MGHHPEAQDTDLSDVPPAQFIAAREREQMAAGEIQRAAVSIDPELLDVL
jgi:hypothetical protein